MDAERRFHRLVRAAKIQILKDALRAHAGNRTRAALALQIPRTYLVRLVRVLGIGGRR